MTDSSPVFTIQKSEEKGRHVVAVRDIAAGDLALVDVPLLLSPHTKSRAQCLECARWVGGGVSRLIYLIISRLVDGTFLCPKCNFPMCSQECSEGATHLQECQALHRVHFEADIEEVTVCDDHYAAILPLREAIK